MSDAYIMVIRNASYHLIGPFDDDSTAAEWAHENNPTDDPRWQTLRLSDPTAAPSVLSPGFVSKFYDPMSAENTSEPTP